MDDLERLLIAAIQTHRNQHQVYGSTATCSGGIGGAAMTQHCAVTCGYWDNHQKTNDAWDAVEIAFFRRKDGDPDWADYIPEV